MKWWVKRAPLAGTLGNALVFLIVAVVMSPAIFYAIKNMDERRAYSSPSDIISALRPSDPRVTDPYASRDDRKVLQQVAAPETEPMKRRKARIDCAETTLRLGKVPPGVKTFATSEAEFRCKKILEMTPDSLLMRQYAGIIALRLGEPEIAFEHFKTILAASPDDAYALFGRGLVSTIAAADAPLGKAKDMSDALALDPNVARYFEVYGLTAPDIEPSARKPRSRMPTPPPVHADAPAKNLKNDKALDGQALADHFGIDNSTFGVVQLECIITVKGRASDCHIKSEEPPNLGLGEIGLLTMKDIRYQPPTMEGEPVGGLGLDYKLTYNVSDDAPPAN